MFLENADWLGPSSFLIPVLLGGGIRWLYKDVVDIKSGSLDLMCQNSIEKCNENLKLVIDKALNDSYDFDTPSNAYGIDVFARFTKDNHELIKTVYKVEDFKSQIRVLNTVSWFIFFVAIFLGIACLVASSVKNNLLCFGFFCSAVTLILFQSYVGYCYHSIKNKVV